MAQKIKRIRNRKNVSINFRNRRNNLYYISTLKTLYKKLTTLIENNSSIADIKKIYSYYISMIDKGIKRNALHRNKGSRRKSKGAKLLKSKLLEISH